MEYDLNQWRRNYNQLEHEQPSAKIPRLLVDEAIFSSQHIQTGSSSSSSSGGSESESALPLFVPEPNRSFSSSSSSNLSAFPDSLTSTTYRFPRIGGLFSLAQWQELELQALIFKYMLAGAAVPPQLLQSINKSFLNTTTTTPACCLHNYPQQQHQQYYHHFQPAVLQSGGYWGRGSMDPEPGRCRRTDGKKWRCSRDVVPGQKYCERHVHRGRNRSRKPVEIPTPAPAGGGQKITNPVAASASTLSAAMTTSGTNFTLTGSGSPLPSMELLHINQSRSSENRLGNGFFQDTRNNQRNSLNEKPDGQKILRHFFDDWPRSNQESNASPATSTTCLSISTPGNPSSDFSLKLSTGGNVDEKQESQQGIIGGERPQLNWAMAWGSHQVSSMGGPLAEALRSSTTNSSPTSVLHELRRGSLSAETSSVST